MRHLENELLPTNAASITDVSHGIVLVLCAAFMVVPFAMLIGLVCRGIRTRRQRRDQADTALIRAGDQR